MKFLAIFLNSKEDNTKKNHQHEHGRGNGGICQSQSFGWADISKSAVQPNLSHSQSGSRIKILQDPWLEPDSVWKYLAASATLSKREYDVKNSASLVFCLDMHECALCWIWLSPKKMNYVERTTNSISSKSYWFSSHLLGLRKMSLLL